MYNSFFFRVARIFLKSIVNNCIIDHICYHLYAEEWFLHLHQQSNQYARFSITVSRSITTSFRSIETTSPVSSSTKSSTHDFKTRAASFRPTQFFQAVLDNFHFISQVENFENIFITFITNCPKKVVTGNFFLRSM